MTLLEIIAICLSWFCAGIAVRRCIDEYRKQNTKKEVTLDGWVARNKNGELWWHEKNPWRGAEGWIPRNRNIISISNDSFPSVTWESEPKKVKITIKAE